MVSANNAAPLPAGKSGPRSLIAQTGLHPGITSTDRLTRALSRGPKQVDGFGHQRLVYEVQSLARWAEIRSLDEIARRCTSLFHECAKRPDMLALRSVGAIGAVMSIYHDPSFSTHGAKRRQAVNMIEAHDVSTVHSFKTALGHAMRAGWLEGISPLFPGATSASGIVRDVFGAPFLQDSLTQSKAQLPNVATLEDAIQPATREALSAFQQRLVQARLREEIFREFPDMYDEFQVMMSRDNPMTYLADDEVDKIVPWDSPPCLDTVPHSRLRLAAA